MIIDRNGSVIDAVQIDDNIQLFDLFRVRVIREVNNKKFCCGEEDYLEFPSNEALMYCIKRYDGDFACIEKIFTLAKLPFSE